MKIIDKLIQCKSRSDVFEFYPFGDVHVGSRACAEKLLAKAVKEVAGNPNAYAFLGGDNINAVIASDTKRFDFDTLPDWMLEGKAVNTREMLNDILTQEVKRLTEIFLPIKDKLLGSIEGGHEYQIRKRHGTNLMGAYWNALGAIDLTAECMIRLRFKRLSSTRTVFMYIRHGYGSGRTAGAEPMKLDRMVNEWELADICFSGHTHTADTPPPKPVLTLPAGGKLPEEFDCKYRWSGNWGCWVYSHPSGPSGYAGRACYPARPMVTCKAVIKPFHNTAKSERPHIEIRRITM